jgi:hypothetical protein
MDKIFDEFIYSIDMVRLATEMKADKFQEIMDKLVYNPYVEYREHKTYKSYRHNFVVKGSIDNDEDFIEMSEDEYGNMYQKSKNKNYSFWVGAEHNAKNNFKNHIDVVIEYNPNKCKDSYLLSYILNEIFLYNSLTVVKRIDFAIDILENIKNIKPIRDPRSSFRIFDNCGDDITYYMRKRGSNGALKIYNKARENKEINDKTRYEITLHIDNDLRYISSYQIDRSLFPSFLYINMNHQTEILNVTGTDRVLIYACIDNPSYLKELSRKKREKIEGYIETLVRKIDFSTCTQIQDTFEEYFNNLSKVKNI